ncbi:hypothetical protein HDU78_002494 [Chytriomyces hyalinus]|nr:hypothetical protein HDU78_002494 [Chytriomyces hyalinus]
MFGNRQHLSSPIKLERMRAVRGVLIDLSGTLHIEETATRDAVAALERLQTRGEPLLKIRFVSNTSAETRASLAVKLRRIGFSADFERRLFTSLSTAAATVAARGLRPLLLVDAGAAQEFGSDCQGLGSSKDGDFDSVVVGLAPGLMNYNTLTQAMNVLLKAESKTLIALHKGRYLKRKDGLALGPGPFVAALEYATDASAEVVGKPTATFFQAALDDMDLNASECVMIGDDVRDDVGGAMAVGMQAILVQTGKYRQGDEDRHGVTPTAMVLDFSAAVDLILNTS